MAHYLYIGLSEDGRISKIGRTECPQSRLWCLNSQCRKKFGVEMRGIALWQIKAETLAQAQAAEQALLSRFWSHSIGSTEWLHATPELIQLASQIGIDPKYSRKRHTFKRKNRKRT